MGWIRETFCFQSDTSRIDNFLLYILPFRSVRPTNYVSKYESYFMKILIRSFYVKVLEVEFFLVEFLFHSSRESPFHLSLLLRLKEPHQLYLEE